MKNLLVINSSGRVTRSITRHLTQRFTKNWLAVNPGGTVTNRDIGQHTPPIINETWIAAAFADLNTRTDAMCEALALSDNLINEIISAEVIVIGSPVYNFGMPASLKAYFDQIVRVGLSFSFEAGATEPYRPLLATKPVYILTAAGDGAMLPGGAAAHLNFLEPHLKTVLSFIGLTEVHFIRVGYDEYQDDRLKYSIAAAEIVIDQLLNKSSSLASTTASVPRD
jgi:FMN-dependent NADH-azoreductase